MEGEEIQSQFLESQTSAGESSRKQVQVCVNCERNIENEDDQVTEFVAIFSDCERAVTLAEALGSVFALRKRVDVNSEEYPDKSSIIMCVKCADTSAILYKAYVELMEQSKATAYLTRIIRQVQLWHLKQGYTFPPDFPFMSKEESEYHYVNSVLAVEFDDHEQSALFKGEDDEDDMSEDDIPISIRRDLRRRELALKQHDDSDREDCDPISFLTRTARNSLKRIPKKRKFSDDDSEDELEVDTVELPEELESSSRHETSLIPKEPSLDELPLSEGEDDELEDDVRKRLRARPTRKRGRPLGRPKGKKNIQKRGKTASPLPEDLINADVVEGVKPEITKQKRPRGKAHLVKEPKLDCPDCSSKFIYYWMLENHILAVHEGKSPIVCSKCGLEFFKEELVEKHTCIPKEVQEEERKKRPHTCKQCGKTFLLLKHVKQHYKCHEEGKPFQCPKCPSSFKSENFLRFHEKLHAEDKSWQCSVCGKVFHVKRNLTIHLDIHEKEKKYLCSLCGEKFAQQKALRRHTSAQHDSNLKHKCPICGKGFRRRDHITQHLNSKVHPKPTLQSTVSDATVEPSPLENKYRGAKLELVKNEETVTSTAFPVITTSTIIAREEETQIFHVQPPGTIAVTNCPTALFQNAHFLPASTQPETTNQAHAQRPTAEFAFSDFITFE